MTPAPVSKPAPWQDPNEKQRAASNPMASVWVNASAGSGKTSVLTKRVMRLLLSGVRPEKILCLTYTRAGAAEMANRITKTLSTWAVCDDPVLYEELDKLQNTPPEKGQLTEARRLFARVLSCPGGLRIRTIHSFCQEILSRFPLEAELPAHFALIEEQDLAFLKEEVLDDLLREAAKDPDGEQAQVLSPLIAAQGEAGFSQTLKEVLDAQKKLQSFQDPEDIKNNLKEKLRRFLELGPIDTAEALSKEVLKNIPEETLRQLAAWWTEGSVLYSKRGQSVYRFLEMTPLDRETQLHTYKKIFLKSSDDAPFAERNVASKDIRKNHPEIDALYAQEAARLISALERIEAAEIAETTEKVLSLGLLFSKRLAERKAARAVLDYDDMILLTERLLTRSGIAPWILYKLDYGIDHILLDEAQDTSRSQWNIVNALTEEFYAGQGAKEAENRTLFVVGDEKQSIFSFQNADPESFLSLKSFFSSRLANAGKTLEKIPFHTSFRSAAAILKAVDAVFAQPAAQEGVSPDPIEHVAYRKPGDKEKTGRVEVWPLLSPPATEKDTSKELGEWDLPTQREDEQDLEDELAKSIAAKISSWIRDNAVLPGEDEPLSPGDIMILLRRRGRFAGLMVRALKNVGIPVTGVDRMRLSDQIPVMDLLAMIRFVLLPEDDLNLATLLRSPLVGLNEEDLMNLAVNRMGSLWASLKPDPSFKVEVDYLTAHLNKADFSTPFAFLSEILSSPCPADEDSGRKALWKRLGNEAMDPIEELLNKAQNFGLAHSPSLQNFLHWLTRADAEIKRELDQAEGQVRIMTIHASKGLEAPIVFLPDTTATPESRGLPKIQYAQEDIPLFLSRAPRYGKAKTVWEAARNRQLEEYRRLLYVAMTRASRRLYICGWTNNEEKASFDKSWYALVSEGLRPLHDSSAQTETESPVPEIAFGDPPPQTVAPPVPQEKHAPPCPLPAWAKQKIPQDRQEQGLSSAPSYAAALATATPDYAFARGRIIHRLLQSLPDIDPPKRQDAVSRFLSHSRHGLTPAQQDDISKEVLGLLSDERFVLLFNSESLAEVPLTGKLKDAVVFRQVDRLCIQETEVWIVDYKTNRPPPENEKDIPLPYRQQIDEYRSLLQGIYPDKKVRCFLLWTYVPLLMEVF